MASSSEPPQQQPQSVKVIEFLGRTAPIVLQNDNGPCPLLAICNVLSLRNNLNLSAETTEVSQEELLSLVKKLIVSKSNTDNKDDGDVKNQQQKIADAIDLLPRLATGIDVNIKFTGISDFEFTPECAIFDLLDISLYHGWIVNPQDKDTADAIGSESYNTLMARELVALETQIMESECNVKNSPQEDCNYFIAAMAAEPGVSSPCLSKTGSSDESQQQGKLIRTFLNNNDRVTSYGLFCLQEGLKERELCVFFRNNHFSTMFKFNGELYLLATDQGYLNQRDLVWEKLNVETGETVFMTENFEECKSENNVTDPQGPPLLHGSLVIHVKEARNLVAGARSRFLGKKGGDVYVTVSLSNAVIGRTSEKNIQNPVWEQQFDVPVAHYASHVIFDVKRPRLVGTTTIGSVRIPAEELCSGKKFEKFFPIPQTATGASLSLSIEYTSIEKMASYNRGVGPDRKGVPGTYFPLRKGGKVTLYQDADCPDGCLPNVMLDDDVEYKHGRCWRDIYDAISDARHLIYIAGWSLNPQVRLLRNDKDSSKTTSGDPPSQEKTLGNLLKEKAAEKGVKVVLLVWEDPTSIPIINPEGFMRTGAKEAQSFFEGSKVQFLLCPGSSLWEILVKNKSYTHHQKTVLVDADAGDSKRKIIAFVGGLDLCLGRYDTPEHPLYRTLQTVHKDDYHNPTFSKRVNVVGCPREPWHDLHCKIEGPAAYDILTNFKQRWGKSPKGDDADALLNIEESSEILTAKDPLLSTEDDTKAWNVQVFPSIDSSSVEGFPHNPEDARTENLVWEQNVAIDMSIHAAYVKAIRAANHFIYIENQYFLGSAYNWDFANDKVLEVHAWNLIPMEIALKIVNKIKAKERFSVYIVIPMWPEGDPSNFVVQRILLWQNRTMQMMYKMIYNALSKERLADKYHPEDYLNFFCLGNREIVNGEDNSAANDSIASEADSHLALSKKSGRFMIYVHSKGMIVDDEYVIVGSANINQRSMGGSRDTEIAMGAYQPHHTWARKLSSPHGKVYGYRMSLWQEHIGHFEECFKQPESLECVQRVRTLSEENWRLFVADEVTDMKGHRLLKYPIKVDQTGQVASLSECTYFPDVGGYILGSLRGMIARLLPPIEILTSVLGDDQD